jgi:ADP-ribosylglycohydrolase
LIERGEAWDRAAEKLYGGGSFGNGSAMRVASVGLLYYGDPPRLREIAYQSSRITHAHELGKEGAAFEKTVTYAISLGGDTDTIGAMAGAISGAYLGIEAIPAEWQIKLENQEYITELGERLWRIKVW